MPFPFAALILAGISFLGQSLLAPKPKFSKPKESTLNDFDVTTAEESRPIAYIAGNVRVAPNITWYGDLINTPITKFVKTSLIAGTRQTLGYRYNLGWEGGLCWGPNVKCKRITYDDKEIFNGALLGLPATTTILQENLFGGEGEEGEGGINWVLDFYSGDGSQPVNAYMQSRVTPYASHNNVCYVVSRGPSSGVIRDGSGKYLSGTGYIGKALQMRELAFFLERLPATVNPSKAVIGSDVNPVEVLYELFTNPLFGGKIPSSRLKTDSWVAASNTLWDEAFGISVNWNNPGGVEEMIQQIVDTIDGAIFMDYSTGLIDIKLVRNDYDPNAIRTFDRTNSTFEDFSRGSWEETINQLDYEFISRNDDYKTMPDTFHDLANFNIRGITESGKKDYKFIYERSLANRAAARDLRVLSLPLAKGRLVTNRGGSLVYPSEPIKINWPEYGLDNKIFRVAKCNYGSLQDGRVRFDVIEDVFNFGDVVYEIASRSSSGCPTVDVTWNDVHDFAQDGNSLTAQLGTFAQTTGAPNGIFACYANTQETLAVDQEKFTFRVPVAGVEMKVGIADLSSAPVNHHVSGPEDWYFYDVFPSGTQSIELWFYTGDPVFNVRYSDTVSSDWLLADDRPYSASDLFTIKRVSETKFDVYHNSTLIASKTLDVPYAQAPRLYAIAGQTRNYPTDVILGPDYQPQIADARITTCRVEIGNLPVTRQAVLEQPYFFHHTDENRLIALAASPGGQQLNFDVYTSTDGGANYSVLTSESQFVPVGELAENYAATTDYYDATGFSLIDVSSLSTVVDVLADEIKNGQGLLWFQEANELVAFEDISYNPTTGRYQIARVWRGVLDTLPQPHYVGEKVWFLSLGGSRPAQSYADSAAIKLKLPTRSVNAALALSSATALDVAFNQNRSERPYPPADFQINGQISPANVGGDLTLTWKHRDRTQQSDVIQQTAANVGPEASVTYTLRFYNAANSLIRTVAGLVGTSYQYTTAQEYIDNSNAVNASLRVELEAVCGSFVSLHKWNKTVSRLGLGYSVAYDQDYY